MAEDDGLERVLLVATRPRGYRKKEPSARDEQMLKAANLNVQFAGDSSGKVVAQDVEAGTSAAYGTIITLTMDSGEDTTHDAPTVTEEIDPANEEG